MKKSSGRLILLMLCISLIMFGLYGLTLEVLDNRYAKPPDIESSEGSPEFSITLKVELRAGEHEVILLDQDGQAWTLSVRNAYDPVFEKGNTFLLSNRRPDPVTRQTLNNILFR